MVKVIAITQGKAEVWHYFESREQAQYQITLAKATSKWAGYVDYSNTEFVIEEVES